MLKPSFSIIIPTLNEEKHLPLLLADLTRQTFLNSEVIIVDGHSDDQTVRLARKFKRQLPSLKIVHSPRRHVCTQRNLGAQHAKSDWLIFMDADNRLPPYFLQGIKYRLESSPTDIATTYVQPDRSYRRGEPIAQAINIVLDLAQNTKKPLIAESMTIINQTIFRRLGGFNEKIDFSEGRTMLEKAISLDLKFKVYKSPSYEYCFRRIRKYGLLNLTTKIAQYEISHLLDLPLKKSKLKKLYPMKGGSFLDTPLAKRNKFRQQIQSLIEELKSPRNLRRKFIKLLDQ